MMSKTKLLSVCALLLTFLFAPAFQRAAKADTSQLYLNSLVDFERYAESIWHPATYPGAPADAGYWGDGGSRGNGGIRGNSGVAVAYAVLVIAQPDDPDTSNRLARIRQALNYDAATHVTGTNTCVDGHQWGWSNSTSGEWQTSLWAGSMGLACLLVQNQLPASTVRAVQRVVASEATHRAGIAPPSGYKGDTKAEENAWDSNILALGAAWMSSNSNAPLWLNAAKKYMANTYTVANTNGDPLASWLTTVNLFPSYGLQNHGFYHPSYEMVAGMSLGDSLLMARLANPAVAKELQPFAEHNVLAVWTNNLDDMLMDSGEFAYPSGLDWSLHAYGQISYLAWLTAHFNQPLARWASERLAKLIRQRQIINGNGMFVGPSVNRGLGDPFFREAVEARRVAIAWLQMAHADYPSGPVESPGANQAYFPVVKIIAQRSAYGFFGISFGTRIMAILEPSVPAGGFPTNVFVTTPRLPGMIGLGALGKPTRAKLVHLRTNSIGFDAEFTLQNGANGTTEVYVKSTGVSVGIVEVPRPAPAVASNTAGSFDVGIENDPLTGGSRMLDWAGGSATVAAMSGVSYKITNEWVCVANHYGMAAGPAGYFSYQAPTRYNRAGAARDTLQFMEHNPFGPRYAVWFPGARAAQTASNASLIHWTVSGTNAGLTFPGPGGSSEHITAALSGLRLPRFKAAPIESVTASSSQPANPATNTIDGNSNRFWVSSGTAPGEGPTPNHPQWLKFTFPRTVAVSEFRVVPRTANNGYGPKTVEMFLDGTVVYQGSMASDATLDVRLPQPVDATNAELLITSAYDSGSPDNPRNVQVVNVSFLERAMPGTFGG